MSLASDLCTTTLDRIVSRLDLREREAEGGGPLIPLVSQADSSPVGSARVFTGDALSRVVYVGLAVPAFQLDSHMLFALTRPESAIPHFTVDSVYAGGNYAFHLDLIPRVDLAVNLAHMDAAFGPLTDTHARVREWEGLSHAQISPRQYAVMSPWMLVHRATAEAFAGVSDPVGTYLEHWLSMVERGLAPEACEGLEPAALAERDARHRAVLFNPDVDPVWGRVARLLGDKTCERVRELLVRP